MKCPNCGSNGLKRCYCGYPLFDFGLHCICCELILPLEYIKRKKTKRKKTKRGNND